jgi:hypothetical protein
MMFTKKMTAANLWTYLVTIHEDAAQRQKKNKDDPQKVTHKIESIFKAKNPEKYIQVKTSIINGGTQIIAICSDITRIKEMEQ